MYSILCTIWAEGCSMVRTNLPSVEYQKALRKKKGVITPQQLCKAVARIMFKQFQNQPGV